MKQQMTIYDYPELLSSKMCRESSQATKGKTSDVHWKNLLELNNRTLIYLDLSTVKEDQPNGHPQDLLRETITACVGQSETLNSTVFRNEENGLYYCSYQTPQEPERYYFVNLSESPTIEVKSHLSWILLEADPKYSLSARACQGILNRAARRGKELPAILKEALESVIQRAAALSRSEADAMGGAKDL